MSYSTHPAIALRAIAADKQDVFTTAAQEAFQRGLEDAVGPIDEQVLPASDVFETFAEPGAHGYFAVVDESGPQVSWHCFTCRPSIRIGESGSVSGTKSKNASRTSPPRVSHRRVLQPAPSGTSRVV
ncbi:hypothetical protein [Corynebacterium phoceense]|uniref:hypothetical protein n=1 Tax=Corynebacterium phoceense TaxID=1686286 RepID=UPI001DCBD57C|nr:hypothetical protein [Corynebacterium phoceense]HJG43551.1 hypothetical protein [Corynebacterium phoceense]